MIDETWSLPWTPDSLQELQVRLFLLLAPNYMGETDDPLADAAKLTAAVNAVIQTMPKS